jgi:hypothetical protein
LGLVPSAIIVLEISHRKEKLMSMTESDRSTIVGVFEDQAQAEQAINELRSAGFSDDQINLVVHRAPGTGEDIISDAKRIEAGESRTDEAPGIFKEKSEVTRTVVTVKAEGREQEAVGILIRNGANNANIPEALEAELAPILGPEAVSTARQSEQPIDARSRDSFFEPPAGPDSPGDPESPLDVGVWDNPPIRMIVLGIRIHKRQDNPDSRR